MNQYLCKGFTILVLLLSLSACFEREGLAPVVEGNWRMLAKNGNRYVVVRGDTLYSIAFRYDQDYRQLAYQNHIRSPYTVRVGQIIYIYPKNARRQPQIARRTHRPIYTTPNRPKRAWPTYRYSRWKWPIQGRVVTHFMPAQGKKGIDIAGKPGQKVLAAANGVVAYSGSGLTGYGNLIIIKHDNQFLTAYGNNSHNLVREGQLIKAGQPIAEIGLVDRRFWGLHFEIRQSGRPINPLNYLQ